jgi:transcription antitermination factor NusG
MVAWHKFLPFRKRSQPFEVGDEVRVIAGPFTAFTGKVEAVAGGRLKVGLAIAGSVVSVDMLDSQVERT